MQADLLFYILMALLLGVTFFGCLIGLCVMAFGLMNTLELMIAGIILLTVYKAPVIEQKAT